MTETRFYEPARLSTPRAPKSFFSLKPLDATTWLRSWLSQVFPNFYLYKCSHCHCLCLEKAGQARLSGFLARLTGKMRPKPGKYGHSQAFLATLATKAWPSWLCYFQGRAFSATLVKKAWPNKSAYLVDQCPTLWPLLVDVPSCIVTV